MQGECKSEAHGKPLKAERKPGWILVFGEGGGCLWTILLSTCVSLWRHIIFNSFEMKHKLLNLKNVRDFKFLIKNEFRVQLI